MSVRATGTSSKNATYKLDPELELAEMKDAMMKFCQGAELMHKRQPTSPEFVAGKRKIYEAAQMVKNVKYIKDALKVCEPQHDDMLAQLDEPEHDDMLAQVDEPEQHDMLAQVVEPEQPQKKIKAAEAQAPEPESTKVVMYAPTNPMYDTPSMFAARIVQSAPTYVASKIQESIRLFSGAAAVPPIAASAAPAPKITVQKAEDKPAAATMQEEPVAAETKSKKTKVVVKTDVVKTNVFELTSDGDEKVVVKTEVVKTEVLHLSSDDEETPAPQQIKAPTVVVSQPAPAEQIKKASPEKDQDLSDDDQPLMKRVSKKKPASARGVSKKNAPAGGASSGRREAKSAGGALEAEAAAAGPGAALKAAGSAAAPGRGAL
jgi:hypothetical protein